MSEPRGVERKREGGEAGSEGEIQELQPDVRRDTQDAEHLGGKRRSTSVGASGLDIGSGDSGV